MQEENHHIGEENGGGTGHEVDGLDEIAGHHPHRLNQQPQIVAALEPGLHALFVVDFRGALHRQAENGEIRHRHHRAADRTQQNPENIKGAHTNETQHKQGGDQNCVADQGAQGDAGQLLTGSRLQFHGNAPF